MKIRKIDYGTLDQVYLVDGPNGRVTIHYTPDYLDRFHTLCGNQLHEMIRDDYFEQTEG
jgi:hypothetical protein